MNYYAGRTEAELLILLKSVQERSSKGVIGMSSGAGIQQQYTFSEAAKIDLVIRRILYSLYLISPSTYDNPYAARVRRTRPAYTGVNVPFPTT